MKKYFKAIIEIIINYHIYSLPVLLFEFYYYIRFQNKYNNFKYLNSQFLSDSIPCSFFFLKKIEIFIRRRKLNKICDLGSGYGKILHFFGKVKKYQIDGYEFDREVYQSSLSLVNKNIKIYNKNILFKDVLKLDYQIFIINDPLKKIKDFKKLIDNLINMKGKKKYLVLINLNQNKKAYMYKNLKIINCIVISPTRNIFFCKIKS